MKRTQPIDIWDSDLYGGIEHLPTEPSVPWEWWSSENLVNL